MHARSALSLYSVLQFVIMHWKAALLVTIAVISGIISACYMYLLSSRGSNYISVALEIPLQRQADHSTNLELKIKSISHERTTNKHPVRHMDPTEHNTTWELSESVDIQQHSVVTERDTVHGSEQNAQHYSSHASHTPVEEMKSEGEMREKVWGEGVMSEMVWSEHGVTLQSSDDKAMIEC